MLSKRNSQRLAWLVSFSLCASPYVRVGSWDHGRMTDVLAPFLFFTALQSCGWRAFRAWLPGIFMLAILSWNVLSLWGGLCDLWPGLGYLAKRAEAFALCAGGFALARQGLPASAVESGVRWGSGFVALSVFAETLLTPPPWRCAGMLYSGQVVQTGLVLLCGMSLAGRRPALLTLLLAATLLTGTRSVLIGLLIIVVALTARERMVRYTLVALLSGWLLAPTTSTGRLQSTEGEILAALQALALGGSSSTHSSLSDRIVAAQTLARTHIAEAPWWGNGTGAVRLGICDNFWVTECVYHGVPGALLWAGLLFALTRQLWRISKLHIDTEPRRLARRSLLWLGLLSLNSLVAESFYLLRPMELIFWFIGVTAGVARGQLPQDHTPRPWWLIAGSLVLCLLPSHWTNASPSRAIAPEATWSQSLPVDCPVRLSLRAGELGTVRVPAHQPIVLQFSGPPAPLPAWSQLASRFYRNQQVLGYSLSCDNQAMTAAAWKDYSRSVVQAIRAVGSQQWIYVAGARQASAQEWTQIHGPAAWVEDPYDRVAYEAELSLLPHRNGGAFLSELATNPDLPALPLRRLQPFARWCQNNRAKGSVIVLPFPADPGWSNQLDSTLEELDRLEFGCTVQWKGGIDEELAALTLPVLDRHRARPSALIDSVKLSRLWLRRQLHEVKQ